MGSFNAARFEVIELKGAEGLKRGFAEMVKGV